MPRQESTAHYFQRLIPKPFKHWQNISKAIAINDLKLEHNGGWGSPRYRVRKVELAGQACFVVEEDVRIRRREEAV